MDGTRSYAKLRAAMVERDLVQADLATHLRRSCDYISRCFRGGCQWRLDEAYEVMRWLGLPPEDIYEYFPPDGYPPKPKPREVR